jgi:hypothetical protein
MEQHPHPPGFDGRAVASRRDLDALVDIAMSWGWSMEIAFVTALQLRTAGITSQQARRMFEDALLRIQ